MEIRLIVDLGDRTQQLLTNFVNTFKPLIPVKPELKENSEQVDDTPKKEVKAIKPKRTQKVGTTQKTEEKPQERLQENASSDEIEYSDDYMKGVVARLLDAKINAPVIFDVFAKYDIKRSTDCPMEQRPKLVQDLISLMP